MKTKNILHLVTFVLTFTVSVTVAGAVKSVIGLSVGEKITNVITEDINNAIKNPNGYNGNIVVSAVRTENYVTASESINTDGLPEDFQIAWEKHMNAWRTHSDYLNERKYSGNFKLEYDKTGSLQSDEINATWWEVLRIARQHGAVIPRRAYY